MYVVWYASCSKSASCFQFLSRRNVWFAQKHVVRQALIHEYFQNRDFLLESCTLHLNLFRVRNYVMGHNEDFLEKCINIDATFE